MDKIPPILLKSEKQRDHLIKLVMSLPLDDEKPLVVTIEPLKKQRSRDQNKLYWKWLAHISMNIIFEGESGVKHIDRNLWHSYLSLKFLEPMWLQRPDTGEEIPVPRSTRQLSVKQFTEYLNKIDEFARDLHVTLPTIEDDYA